jgi:hypothetical protein
MPASAKRKKRGFSTLPILGPLLSAPISFLNGFVVGVVAPVSVVAGVVGGVYLFTKRVPFISQRTAGGEATGERRLTLELMTPDEARAALEVHQAEFKAMWDKLSAELVEVTGQTRE